VVLICLYIFGGESTNHFALMLIVGIISGTYSSIFLASPLLVYLAGDKSIQLSDAEVEAKTKQDQEKVDPGLV
jgi:preprotein translocase subunit SecF